MGAIYIPIVPLKSPIIGLVCNLNRAVNSMPRHRSGTKVIACRCREVRSGCEARRLEESYLLLEARMREVTGLPQLNGPICYRGQAAGVTLNGLDSLSSTVLCLTGAGGSERSP